MFSRETNTSPLGAHFLGDPLTFIDPDEATADTSELQWKKSRHLKVWKITRNLNSPNTFRFSRQSGPYILAKILRHYSLLPQKQPWQAFSQPAHQPSASQWPASEVPGGAGRLWLTRSLGSWRNENKLCALWTRLLHDTRFHAWTEVVNCKVWIAHRNTPRNMSLAQNVWCWAYVLYTWSIPPLAYTAPLWDISFCPYHARSWTLAA